MASNNQPITSRVLTFDQPKTNIPKVTGRGSFDLCTAHLDLMHAGGYPLRTLQGWRVERLDRRRNTWTVYQDGRGYPIIAENVTLAEARAIIVDQAQNYLMAHPA